MTRGELSGQFISGPKGPIFLVLRRPSGPARGCVLVVPPFAEEMNKCRRMVTETALALLAHDIATMVPDLYGTGDSGGDFAEADWTTWLGDLRATSEWAATAGHTVTGLLAIRLGAALAASALEVGALPVVQRSVLWQPVFDAPRHLAQFLRLRVAASLMEDRRESLADLRARLQRGETLEVAGYALSGRLAGALEALSGPATLPAALGAVHWLEVVREAGAGLPPPAARLVEQSRSAGLAIDLVLVPGEPYWSATEIVVNPDVVARSAAALAGLPAPVPEAAGA